MILGVYVVIGPRPAAPPGRSPGPSLSPPPVGAALAGTVLPARDAALAVPVGGTVVEVAVQPGATVEAGQLLVRVDGAAQAAALKRAELEKARAQAILVRTQDEREALPVTATSAQRKVAAQDIIVAAAENLLAQFDVDQARAEQALTSLTAPFAGLVASVDVEVGELVTPSRTVVRLLDVATWRIEEIGRAHV